MRVGRQCTIFVKISKRLKNLSVIQSIMGNGPFQPIIQPVTIETMLNNNVLNIGDSINFVTCEQTLNPQMPCIFKLTSAFNCWSTISSSTFFLWSSVKSNSTDFLLHKPMTPFVTPSHAGQVELNSETLNALTLMAYLHCRIRTRIQTRTQTPNPMATLHYAEVFILHRVRFRFQS